MLTETDLAHLAGIIDVMGRVRVMETEGGTELPLLAVSSPNTALLSYLCRISDVRQFETRRTYDRHRCTEHCKAPHEHIVSRSRRWSVTGAKATVILAAIRPYLRLKAEEADQVLKIGLDAPRKKATPAKMKRLGWPMPEGWDL